jgi:uncharacterized membrane protein
MPEMLQLFPFFTWLAAGTSVVMLVLRGASGELRWSSAIALGAWLLIAGGCQFLGRSAIVSAVGLALQTLLAIYLILRWRFSSSF